MSRDDGGPAFPFVNTHVKREDKDTGNEIMCAADYDKGMTLRDWFAGKAMAAMIATAFTEDGAGAMLKVCKGRDGKPADWIAELAYGHADAMLAQRAKP